MALSAQQVALKVSFLALNLYHFWFWLLKRVIRLVQGLVKLYAGLDRPAGFTQQVDALRVEVVVVVLRRVNFLFALFRSIGVVYGLVQILVSLLG